MPSENEDQPTDTRDPALLRAEADIAATREKVEQSIAELQREIARTFDWRRWVRRKPVLAMGVAFGLGLLLGRRD